MFADVMTLPDYHMVAGESKNITIPIYNRAGKQIDATGITARMAISDFVNFSMSPLVIKDCTVIPKNGDTLAVLYAVLDPADTVNLYGKFIYQVTAKDVVDDLGIMRGILTISPNQDRMAILI